MKKKSIKVFNLILRNYNNDLSRLWFISYQTLNSAGDIIWRQYRGDINTFSSAAARLEAAKNIFDFVRKYGDIPAKKQGVRAVNKFKDLQIFKSVDLYLKDIENKIKISTQKVYKYLLDSFIFYSIEQKINSLHSIDRNKAIKFIELGTVTNTTKNNRILIMTTFYNWLLDQKFVKVNPFIKIKKYQQITTPKAAFKKEQRELINNFLIQNNEQMHLYCMFIFYCFVRPGELIKLKIENIWIEEGKLEIPADVAKNNKKQFVLIPDQLQKLIIKYKILDYPGKFYIFSGDNKPGPQIKHGAYFYRNFRKILKELNFSYRYSLYSWKHTGAAACALAGIPIKELQLQLRHASLKTTDIYLQSIGIFDSYKLKYQFPDV